MKTIETVRATVTAKRNAKVAATVGLDATVNFGGLPLGKSSIVPYKVDGKVIGFAHANCGRGK